MCLGWAEAAHRHRGPGPHAHRQEKLLPRALCWTSCGARGWASWTAPEAYLHEQRRCHPLLSPFWGPTPCSTQHALSQFVGSVDPTMWILRPQLRKVGDLLTHSQQEEPSGFKPTSSLSPSRGWGVQNLPIAAFSSQVLLGPVGFGLSSPEALIL